MLMRLHVILLLAHPAVVESVRVRRLHRWQEGPAPVPVHHAGVLLVLERLRVVMHGVHVDTGRYG